MLAAIKDRAVFYSAEFEEYAIPVRDGGSSGLVMSFCPWCGQRLPESTREQWFQKKERAGEDPWESPRRRPARKKTARPT